MGILGACQSGGKLDSMSPPRSSIPCARVRANCCRGGRIVQRLECTAHIHIPRLRTVLSVLAYVPWTTAEQEFLLPQVLRVKQQSSTTTTSLATTTKT